MFSLQCDIGEANSVDGKCITDVSIYQSLLPYEMVQLTLKNLYLAKFILQGIYLKKYIVTVATGETIFKVSCRRNKFCVIFS